MHYFEVLYKFDAMAGSDEEMSVLPGDMVRTEKVVELAGGWVQVEMAHNPRKRGIVPLEFLREVPSPAQQQQQQAGTVGADLSVSRSNSPQTQTFTSAAVQHGRDTLGRVSAAGDPVKRDGGFKPSSKWNPAQLMDGFMNNEIFYKNLMKSREAAMLKMSESLKGARSDLAVCQEKSAHLSRKLQDLDTALERERSKWRARVEEERVLLAKKAGGAGIPSAAYVTTTTTTSRSRYEER